MQEANYKGFKIRAHAQLMAESRVEGKPAGPYACFQLPAPTPNVGKA